MSYYFMCCPIWWCTLPLPLNPYLNRVGKGFTSLPKCYTFYIAFPNRVTILITLGFYGSDSGYPPWVGAWNGSFWTSLFHLLYFMCTTYILRAIHVNMYSLLVPLVILYINTITLLHDVPYLITMSPLLDYVQIVPPFWTSGSDMSEPGTRMVSLYELLLYVCVASSHCIYKYVSLYTGDILLLVLTTDTHRRYVPSYADIDIPGRVTHTALFVPWCGSVSVLAHLFFLVALCWCIPPFEAYTNGYIYISPSRSAAPEVASFWTRSVTARTGLKTCQFLMHDTRGFVNTF